MKNKTIGLFGKYGSNEVETTLQAVRSRLESFGARVWLGDTTAAEISGKRVVKKSSKQKLDLAIVVGGDGTLLHAARALAPFQVPIVGINLGTLGFLTDIPASEIEASLEALREGNYEIELRAMLTTRLIRGGEHQQLGLSLNDVVLSKGETGRLFEMRVDVDGQFVSVTRSDGLIFSSPTGSTAYALAAGGPIISPTVPVWEMVPVCPHTLSNRPIILSQTSSVTVSDFHLRDNSANLALDGIIKSDIREGDTVEISIAGDTLPLIRIGHHDHFEALRSKLGWFG